jgi:hypothetical protein
MAKTSDDAMKTMIANLKTNTGKSLEQWTQIVRAQKFSKHGEALKYLKAEHGISHGYANLIAHSAFESAAMLVEDKDELIESQYAGAKSALRPIYDALIAKITKFGRDVEISPKKTYVSLRRNKQFGLIQPSTATRVDVGINLKGIAPGARLEASGSFNAMVTHRVRLESKSEVDAELIAWLKQAYDAS